MEDVLHQLFAVEVGIQLAGLIHAADDLPDGPFRLAPQLVRAERIEVEAAQIERGDQAVVDGAEQRTASGGGGPLRLRRGARSRRRRARRRMRIPARRLSARVARHRRRHRRLFALGGQVLRVGGGRRGPRESGGSTLRMKSPM